MGTDEDTDDASLVRQAAGGDAEAFARLVGQHEPRLRRQVRMRLDARLQRRVDVSDVLQEVRIEAHARLHEYVAKPEVPFFLWLRFLTKQRVAQMHRFHFGAQARDARREVRVGGAAGGDDASTSVSMAEVLAADVTSPSDAAARGETERRLREALDSMDPMDREILCLRHFEQLGNAEAAREIGIESAAASKRYVRALRRLKDVLGPHAV
jgi:RNA polymerase sigma-70 factor (ECF subfamily)